jgi:hypothetical protein
MEIRKLEGWFIYPVLFFFLCLIIYSRWGQWSSWLYDVSYALLIFALGSGLIIILVIALILYPGERKERVKLEQEIAKRQYLNAQVTYMDEKGDICTKEQAVKVYIIEALPDGSSRETYGTINRGKA